MKRLQDRVAVITGGGRGIGATIALHFAREGAHLVLASRTASELEQVAERCRHVGVEVLSLPTDVSDRKQIQGMIETTLAQFSNVDILVNAAGIYGPIGPLVDVDAEHWVRALHVNLLGTLYSCQAVLPGMIRARRGKIINFSGGGAAAPLPCFSAYGVSKAAVVRLTETLAEETREYAIDVNAIAPGAVDTRLQDEVLAAGERAGKLYDQIRKLRETGAGGTPPDRAADLAVFLASDDSNGLTGKLISAPHDPWPDWVGKGAELSASPMFTLRRVDPFTLKPLIRKL